MQTTTPHTLWFAQLGRERKLAINELAAATPTAHLDRYDEVVVGDGMSPIWENLGSTMRSGVVVAQKLESLTAVQIAIQEYTKDDTGKLTIGLTCLDPTLQSSKYRELGREIKTRLQAAGHSVRTVPAMQGNQLNAAQVLYNQLHTKNFEFTLWRTPAGWTVGRTTWVQDIDSYTLRDRKRPARDARIGMLPPKLAQTLINLAQAPPEHIIYDPFCGTGVILMEASRMGYQVAGSDINPKMVEATEQNLDWYQSVNPLIADLRPYPTSIQDASNLILPSGDMTIVCEGYLGRVDLKGSPRPVAHIQAEAFEMDTMYRRILKHWHRIPNLHSIVIALPFWSLEGRKIRLALLDDHKDLGYNFMQFVGTADQELSYHRPDQIVGRMIVKLTKS